jgi:hypothetical protein
MTFGPEFLSASSPSCHRPGARGDNAIVIALAARNLPKALQKPRHRSG